MDPLREHIDNEIKRADDAFIDGDLSTAFHCLERAHVLGQAITYQHTRIHWRMLKLGLKMQSPREIFGQIVRIVGAASKTPLGIYPTGNTGGANVWFFKPMPIPDDLREILKNANEG
jgi:Protein of unknown function (DUF3703)